MSSNKEMTVVRDPFTGKDAKISSRLTDRLRGKYAVGPQLPDGNPEFGWRQVQTPPIQHEAAQRIERLEACIRAMILGIPGGNYADPQAIADDLREIAESYDVEIET